MDPSKKLDALSAAHIVVPHDLVGDPPPALVSKDNASQSVPYSEVGDVLDKLTDPAVEYYGRVIGAVHEKLAPWLAKIHARSTEHGKFPFVVTSSFVMAWMGHVLGGGVSPFVLKDSSGEYTAMALLNMENSLLSGYQRLAIIGYVADTPELEEELLGKITEYAEAMRDVLGNPKIQIIMPMEAQQGNEVRRVIVEV